MNNCGKKSCFTHLTTILCLITVTICTYHDLYALNVDSLRQALTTMPKDSTRVMALIDLCYHYDRNDAIQIKPLAEEALALAQKVDYQTGIANGHFALGLYYDKVGEYDLSLQHYLESIAISEQSGRLYNVASTYNSIGISYRKQNNLKEALYYYKKSVAIGLALKEYKSVAGDYVNIGNVYADMEERDSAIHYYNTAKTYYLLHDANHPMPYVKLNLAIQYEEQGFYERAETLYHEALASTKQTNDLYHEIVILTNLGYLETKKGSFTVAEQYLQKALQLSNKSNHLQWKQTIYEGLSILYEKQEDHKRALLWTQRFLLLRDSFFNLERDKTVSLLQERYKSEQKEKQILLLNQTQAQQQQNRKWLLFSLLFIILTAIAIIQWQRWKRAKEQELATHRSAALAAQMKALEHERTQIKTALAYKEKELTNFALHLVQKNEFIEHIEQSLQEVTASNSEERKKIREIIVELRQNQLIGNEMNQFHQRLNEINGQFFLQLEQTYPQLTKNEKQLAALLRLDLSTKEIATLNRVTEQAVKMSRHRMRKRLNIDSQVNLNAFFKEIGR